MSSSAMSAASDEVDYHFDEWCTPLDVTHDDPHVQEYLRDYAKRCHEEPLAYIPHEIARKYGLKSYDLDEDGNKDMFASSDFFDVSDDEFFNDETVDSKDQTNPVEKIFSDRVCSFHVPKSRRFDHLVVVQEFLDYSYEVLRRIVAYEDLYPRTLRVENGVLVLGKPADFKTYRLFYDCDSECFRRTSEYRREIHLNVYCTEDCKILPEFEFTKLRPLLPHTIMPLTVSGPGCGKSYSLRAVASKCDPLNTLVLSATRLTCKELQSKLPGYAVLTYDSYLMNYNCKCDVVLMDECAMVHPGKLLLCLQKCQAAVAHGFADALQIPFIDRLGYGLRFTDILSVFAICNVLETSFRCPQDVVHALHPLYERKFANTRRRCDLSSRSAINRSVEIRRVSEYRADRFDVTLVYDQDSKAQYSATTIHEFQGKEARRVAVVNTLPANHSLLKSMEHAVVAISRHTTRFVYFTDDTTGLLYQLCERAIDATNNDLVGVSGGATVDLPLPEFRIKEQRTPMDYSMAPRSRLTALPPSWKSKRVLEIVPGKSSKVTYTTGKHAKLVIPSGVNYNYQQFRQLLSTINTDIEGRFVAVQSGIVKFNEFLLNRLLNEAGAVTVRHIGSVDDYLCPEIHNAAVSACLEDTPELVTVDQSITMYRPDLVKIPAYTSMHPIENIQRFLCAFMLPEVCYEDMSCVATDFHLADYSLHADGIRYDLTAPPMREKKFVTMEPVLRSPCPYTQISTPRHVFHSIVKRNANVPKLAILDPLKPQVDFMVSSLLRLCPGLDLTPINVTRASMSDWLKTQPDGVKAKIEAEFPLHERQLDTYQFILKGEPKPNLERTCNDVYPAPQSILCHPKDVNAIFCPLIRVVRDRILESLDSRFQFFTKMDEDTFASVMTENFPPSEARGYYCYEFDMSKYDKSQGELVLEFECGVFTKFGVPPYLVSLWRNAHVHTHARDMQNRISFDMWFQRKSGDASTYFGNTLILMMALLDVLPESSIGFAAFSGDDSLVFSRRPPNLVNYQVLADRYNFEVKRFDYVYHYFCSKFVLEVEGRWVVVPDPLKRAVKLGRRDLRNPDHVEEYRVSYADNVRAYDDLKVLQVLNEAVCERYSVYGNYVDCLSALYQISQKGEFEKLFEIPLFGELNYDLKRPVLD